MQDKTVLNYIKNDPVSFVHVNELNEGEYTIIYAGETGFIVSDNRFDFIYISFSNEQTRKEQLSKHRYRHYLAYEKETADFYGDTDKTIRLNQYVYLNDKKFDIDDCYDIRVLDETYIDMLNKCYKALGPGEDNAERIKSKEVLGLFVDNKLAGFIGRHPEGCLGMLQIFEPYRKKGYATILEKAKINDLINRKQKVFSEVVENNFVSHHMHESLGYTKGAKTIYWLL